MSFAEGVCQLIMADVINQIRIEHPQLWVGRASRRGAADDARGVRARNRVWPVAEVVIAPSTSVRS
jgi:hypothetical protein